MSAQSEAIAELAAKPDIAAYFRELGIKGEREESQSCPVAVWLTNQFDYLTEVNPETVSFCDDDGEVEEFDLPQPVKTFIQRFDAAEFPELDEHPVRWCEECCENVDLDDWDDHERPESIEY